MPGTRPFGWRKRRRHDCGDSSGFASSITAMAKVNLFPDFKEFLESLNSGGVKYLLLGGYAVIHYGYRRATDDLDIWIAIDPGNAIRVAKVLREFGGFSARAV